MAKTIKHWQNDNVKYTNKSSRVNVNNPDFNPATDVVGEDTRDGLFRNQKKWADLIAYLRWFPDIFYDLITPETGASIKLEVYQRMELRCLSRFQGNYITKTRGSGKCISGDSLILTSDGIKEIGSLFSFQCDNKETIYEQDVEIVNRYGNIEKSYKGIYSGKKPTKKIKTRLGYSIECTHNHPLLVMNDNGELEYKESKDLKVGDFLCLRRGDNVWGTETFDLKNIEILKTNTNGVQYINEELLSASKETMIQILNSIMKNKVTNMCDNVYIFITESYKLAKQLQVILTNFGCLCNIEENSDNYRLFINTKVDKRLFYEPIEEIVDSENDVYDLETTETHSFVANGIVNHNTLVSMMNAFHTCIFYPNIQIGLTAQTRENSAKLIKDKYDEFIRAFPLLKEEIYSAKFSKDVAEVEFHNGSRLTNLANQQSSKGAHLQRGLVDEDNLTDEETYLDVLEPIFTTVPRLTVGKKCVVDPYERNFSISQTTSSGFRGSSAYYRCLKKYHNMLNLKGEMCLGASWKMGVFYGRGASKSDILKKKETNSSVSFDMNYNAVWTGAADDALVSMAKFLACRTLGTAEIKGDEQHIYGLGVDIARSDNTGNNQTSISVLKVVKRPTGRIKEVQVVNIIPISGTLDFEAQAIEIKRIDKFFNTEFIVVDENGMGRGISDFLVKEQIDPLTGESLGCLDTMNSDRIPEIPNSPKKIFCYLAQKYDNESIMTFIDYVETKKLRLLEKKDTTSYASMQKNSNDELDRLPFLQTDFLFEEVSNLKLKKLNNGGLSIDRISKKVNKDRFSSVQYGLWYAVKNYDFAETNNSDDLGELAKYIMW